MHWIRVSGYAAIALGGATMFSWRRIKYGSSKSNDEMNIQQVKLHRDSLLFVVIFLVMWMPFGARTFDWNFIGEFSGMAVSMGIAALLVIVKYVLSATGKYGPK
jgi:hypothetical protein